MHNWWLSPVALVAIFAIGGCTKDEETDTDADADTDADSDTDTDTDSDADTDVTDTADTGEGGPLAWCPAWEGKAAEAGTYTVVVQVGLYGCADETTTTAKYKLEVDGADADTLALATGGDDATEFTGEPVGHTILDGTATVTDTNTDTVPDALAGTANFTRTFQDVVSCDVDFTLASTEAYTGECEDCDFGFKVTSTITADNSTTECTKDFAYYALTFQPAALPDSAYYTNNSLSDNWIGYAQEMVVGGFFGYTYYYDNLIVGGNYNYTYDGTPGTYPLAIPLATEYGFGTGDTYATGSTTTFDGTTLDFTIDLREVGCDAEDGTDGTGPAGGQSVDEELPCDGSRIDIFTFDAAAGAELSVSVDTVDGTAFGDGYISIFDANGCTVWASDDVFECTVQPPE